MFILKEATHLNATHLNVSYCEMEVTSKLKGDGVAGFGFSISIFRLDVSTFSTQGAPIGVSSLVSMCYTFFVYGILRSHNLMCFPSPTMRDGNRTPLKKKELPKNV